MRIEYLNECNATYSDLPHKYWQANELIVQGLAWLDDFGLSCPKLGASMANKLLILRDLCSHYLEAG